MDFLKVADLCKSFGGLMAVSHLDFDLQEGEIIGLIGPNGSGKTTMLNLLTGFLKPDSGTIALRGENVAGLPRYRISQKGVARTFQLTKTFFEFTALQNVMVGRSFGQQPARNMRQAAEESRQILEQVGLGDKAAVPAKDLILMQRKMLELARALATRPHLLLLDELMAGLNHGETEEACALIRRIRDGGMTIVVVEHIVQAIVNVSDRIMVLNMGEKIAQGPPEDIIHNPHVIEVYLGKSYA
jgi:ABC-type branched-subunit amino acid transport system ATPase component